MKILVLGQMWASHAFQTDEHRICEALRGMGHEVLAYSWARYSTILEERPKVDFVLAAKGLSGKKVLELRACLDAPIFYWCWDAMDGTEWSAKIGAAHRGAACSADGYFGNNLALAHEYRKRGATFHYLQMDVASIDLLGTRVSSPETEYDVVFTGTHYVREWTNRSALLAEVRDAIAPVGLHIFGRNWRIWEREGFLAHPGVWEQNYVGLVERTKIVLALSARHDIEGYWSNRIAWILMHSGFALAKYTSGMERTFGPDGENLVYWDTPADCADKVRYYLAHEDGRQEIAERGQSFARRFLTFEYRLQQMLTILRYEYGIG